MNKLLMAFAALLVLLFADSAQAQRRIVFAANVNAQSSVTVTVKEPYMGSVIVEPSGRAFEGGQYKIGTKLKIKAVPLPEYVFVEWTVNGKRVSTDAEYTLTVAQKEHKLVATFGLKYIDLGLESGTLWATMNLGVDRYDRFEDYYAWGETSPKKEFSEEAYSNTLTTIDAEHDAARQAWGGEWSIPTREQWQELIEGCEWEYIKLGGVPGYRGISKATGNTAIFLPAAGLNKSWKFDDSEGSYYMSSTGHESEQNRAFTLMFSETMAPSVTGLEKWKGIQIRPVFVRDAR